MSVITEFARPKVNLTLAVRGRRHDGYHEIESIIVFATGIGDVIRLVPGGKTSLRVRGSFATAISGGNVITTVLARLTDAEPGIQLGSVELEKNLPVAAGIGGGSADAAAVLRAVRRANAACAEAIDWHGIAASLGADVPVCLANAPAFVAGMGERITMLPGLPPLPAVLANPMVPVPADKTTQVFSQLSAQPAPETGRATQETGPLQDPAALVEFMREQGNDLMRAAIAVVPDIEHVHATLAAADGCAHAGLSGAGPTCFGIFESGAAAASAVDALRQAHPQWWIVGTALGG